MIGLIHTVDILTQGAAGTFTTLAHSGLRCRLRHMNSQSGALAAERAELGQMRVMVWEPTPELPEQFQAVTPDGTRYNALAGTFKALPGPTGALMYRSVTVMRAVDG